jgi:hypothetical protein
MDMSIRPSARKRDAGDFRKFHNRVFKKFAEFRFWLKYDENNILHENFAKCTSARVTSPHNGDRVVCHIQTEA